MNRLAQHLLIVSLSAPLSYAGYHALAETGRQSAHAADIDAAAAGFAVGAGYQLDELALLNRTLYYVSQRYVDSERVDPERMFQAALERVERQVPEVMFVREPAGRRLQVSVGTYDTVLLIDPIENLDRLYASLRRVAAILDEHVSSDVKLPELEYAFINGALSTLDPHSVLLPPRAAREMGVDNQGEFGGLGVKIQVREGRLAVDQPLEGTPAERAGLRSGDRILRIEGESTLNMDLEDAVTRLRGEIGTPVTILVERRGVSEPFEVAIVRARIDLNPVSGELLEGAIGYVRLKQFHRKVGRELDDLLARFHRELNGKPLKGLVLDLRGNPGGYLNQAVAVSDKFLEEGVIVATVEGGGRRRDEERAKSSGTEPAFPLAVLVDGNSASASEIVAGALKNQGRAVIIGERTFGKGSVQHLYPNNQDDSSLKLTVAKYLTPGDHSIQSVGIPPDVQLIPSVVRAGEPDDDGKPGDELISLYWREWVDREASLERHLESVEAGGDNPAFAVRYLRDEPSGDVGGDAVRSDWEVEFTRELLLAAEGGRRAQILKGAGTVVAARAEEEARRVEAAFASLGIDWTAGTNPAEPQVSVKLVASDDNTFTAGESEWMRVELTNLGDEPLWQLSAVTHSEIPWLDLREFYFGHLAPGETRVSTRPVSVPAGARDESAHVDITLRDPSNASLLEVSRALPVDGLPLPAFAYTLTFHDDGSGRSKGNGDGKPQPGEVIEIEVAVENVGVGAAEDLLVRLRNESGRAVDLRQGRVHMGIPKDGKPCAKDEDCDLSLAATQTATERLTFALDALPESGVWELQLKVGDQERFDHTTVYRAGFYDHFQLEEALRLSPDQPFANGRRVAPTIQVSRTVDLETHVPDVVLSGIVTDDQAVRDLVIFHDKDKIFYRGGQGDQRVPFTASPELHPGVNLIVVLARDAQGLQSSWSVPVWYGPVDTVAAHVGEP